MKKKIFPVLAFAVLFLAAFMVVFPAIASAYQCNDGDDNGDDGLADFEGTAAYPKDPDCSGPTDDSEDPVVTATDGTTAETDLSFGIINPLDSDLDTLPKFINRIVEIFLMVGTPIVALMIIYSGFLFVIARGNAEAIEKAKATLGYTLLGAAILLGAFVISTAIQDTIVNISKESTTE